MVPNLRFIDLCESGLLRRVWLCLTTPHGGLSTGARTLEGLKRISEANLKHGRRTKEKLAANRHSADVGRRVRAELKRIEAQLINAGLMPDCD